MCSHQCPTAGRAEPATAGRQTRPLRYSLLGWIGIYSHSLRSTFPRFLFPLGYGGLKRVFASKFVVFSVFPQFSKLWVSNWYHSLVSFRLKNRLGKSDYSFQKSDTWTGIHWTVALRLKVTCRSCSSWSIFIVAQTKWLCNDGNVYSSFRSTNV